MHQNIGFAIIYNIVAMPLAFAGLVSPLIAAIAMSTSSLLVIGNSLRLNRLSETTMSDGKGASVELTKSVNSVAFTNFGTKNETGGVNLFEQLRTVVVETPSKYFSNNLFITEDHNNKPTTWSIGGKIDGIYTNNDGDKVILEIKNRMRGLFNSLRDYEKVQCYAYMHILDLEQVSLAECYKTKEGNEIRDGGK